MATYYAVSVDSDFLLPAAAPDFSTLDQFSLDHQQLDCSAEPAFALHAFVDAQAMPQQGQALNPRIFFERAVSDDPVLRSLNNFYFQSETPPLVSPSASPSGSAESPYSMPTPLQAAPAPQKQQRRRPPLTSTNSAPVVSTTAAVVPTKNAAGKFQCDECTRSYLHAKHLKRHMLRHTGDRPYKCTLCADSFCRSDILKRHFEKCQHRKRVAAAKAAAAGALAPSPAGKALDLAGLSAAGASCGACAAARVGCVREDGRICFRCAQTGLACTVGDVGRYDRDHAFAFYRAEAEPKDQALGFGYAPLQTAEDDVIEFTGMLPLYGDARSSYSGSISSVSSMSADSSRASSIMSSPVSLARGGPAGQLQPYGPGDWDLMYVSPPYQIVSPAPPFTLNADLLQGLM